MSMLNQETARAGELVGLLRNDRHGQFFTGQIRAGRTLEQKQKLIKQIGNLVKTVVVVCSSNNDCSPNRTYTFSTRARFDEATMNVNRFEAEGRASFTCRIKVSSLVLPTNRATQARVPTLPTPTTLRARSTKR